MNRKILIISSRPIDSGVIDELQESEWTIHSADTVNDARRELEEHDFLVGMFVLWPEDDERYRNGVVDIVRSAKELRWIGGLGRGEAPTDSCLALVTEHLHDFVSLPLDPLRLAVIAGHAYGMAELDRLYRAQQQTPMEGRFGMLGTSAPMRELFEAVQRASTSDAPIVLFGETGSGKQTTARAIHAASSRAERPFVVVQCATLPPASLPSELQGDETAIPPASNLERAFSEKNAGGTLYLDNIADLPSGAQARLLSLIDRGIRHSSRKNGGASPWDGAHLRLMCSSDIELSLCVQDGTFRCDLFYRLQVLSIRLPSLRERDEDVWTLARHFLEQFQEGHSTSAQGFSNDSLAVLSHHDWPGNLRELRNRVHTAALNCDGPYITPSHLDLERRGPKRNKLTLQEAREEAERQAIDGAVRRNRLNLTRAAEELGVSRMTLYRMLEKHGIDVER